MNHEYVLELLIEKISKDFPDDISLLAIMGSYARGTYHDHSDLDLYFVPKTARGSALGFTFILQGIGYDFWPITFERLESISCHKEPLASILLDAKVCYYHSDEDLIRFKALQKQAGEKAQKEVLIPRLSTLIHQLEARGYRLLLKEDINSFRLLAMEQVREILNALCLLYGIAPTGNYKKNKEHLRDFPGIPDDFFIQLDGLFEATTLENLKSRITYTTEKTLEVMNTAWRTYQKPSKQAKEVMDGFFEELVNHYHKIRYSVEQKDSQECLIAATGLENELHDFLSIVSGELPAIPSMLAEYDPNHLEKMIEAARVHEAALLSYLNKEQVPLKIFTSLESFRTYLMQL